MDGQIESTPENVNMGERTLARSNRERRRKRTRGVEKEGKGSFEKRGTPVSIDRRYASVDRIDNSIKCPHITLLIAPLSRDASRRWASSKLSTPWFSALLPLP